ncbi:MAG: NAD-dependent epimerase/dehydratase family protein [Pseudomonadota bacterium]
MAALDSVLRKLAVLFAGALALSWLLFLGLGLWNRIRGGWRSVFFCYPGETAHVARYAPPLIWRMFRFFPMPIGVLHQAGGWGLVMAAPVTEDEMLNPANARRFARLQRRLALVARVIGAEQVNLAGVLPGVVRHGGILELPDRRAIVVGAVMAAARHLRDRDFGGAWPPVIVLGGAGYVGALLAAALAEEGAEVHVVDHKAGDARLPKALRGAPALLIDAARRGALSGYVEGFWPGLVVLNETFPMPSRARVAEVLETGAAYWHLAGVRGTVRPPLPAGYAGAVPCCAAHALDDPPEVALIALKGA